MAESSKLRLVRCPKCENLLPELPDYSVYQCGGCGAVLLAKKGNPEGADGSQKSDEERVGVVSDKSNNCMVKSEKFVEKNEVSGVENGEGKCMVSDKETDGGVVERFENELKKEMGKSIIEDENSNKNEVGIGNVEAIIDRLETQVENGNGSRRSGNLYERKLSDRSEEDELFQKTRKGFERMRFSSSSHVDEGTSRYNLNMRYRNETSRAGVKPEYEDPDREELLRKLDELKEQLNRVQNVSGKPHEKSPLEHRIPLVEPYGENDEFFRRNPSSFNRVSRQFSAPNKHGAGASCFEYYHDPFPVINRPDVNVHNYHGSMPNTNHIPRCEDSFEPQMFRRPPLAPRRIPNHHQYASPELDSFDPYGYDVGLHHLTCSCYQCYDPQRQVPMQMPPSSFGNKRFPHVVNKAMPYHHELHSGFGSHGYNNLRVVSVPPMGSCEPPSSTKWPSDLNHEMGGAFPRPRPQRVISSNELRCQPIVGGAPFITCHKCFELLKLPKKAFSGKNEWKTSCGACSTVNAFVIVDEKLVSLDTPSKLTTTQALSGFNDRGRGFGRRDNGSFCSEDYANSVYDFQAMDREPHSSSTCQGVGSSKSEETHNFRSVSATTSEDEHFSDDLVVRQGNPSTAEPSQKGTASPSPPGSPHQEPFDYNSKIRAVNRCAKGNLSSRSDQERVTTNKNNMRQNSLKESLESEMEISLNDYPNTGVQQETSDAYKEDDQPKGKKGGDSFLTGIIKKSFSRSNQTTESGKRNVTVNGQVVPDRLVKKAEKLAGPVHPGQYWYDHRAGFWGAMGGPCLGIVPPYIEEFNYPMPENCAGGNTDVFVNGRELHEKDLELLTTRGLPTAKDRSYIIDISGRVVDEDTGEELDSLGKLAPTVEKVKHGFGMRVPKAAA